MAEPVTFATLGTGAKSWVGDIVGYVTWGVLIILAIYLSWNWYRNKKIFTYQVRIFRQRQGGRKKEFNTMGGYLKSKTGVTEFWIKLGRFRKFKMPSIPDPDMMDEEDRLYYHQISPTDYIQTRCDWEYEPQWVENPDFIEPRQEEKEKIIKDWVEKYMEGLKAIGKEVTKEDALIIAEEEYEKWLNNQRGSYQDVGKVTFKPVATATRESLINDLTMASKALGVDANKQFLYFVIGAICIVALGGLIFYIATNGGKMPFLDSMVLLGLPKLKNKVYIKD